MSIGTLFSIGKTLYDYSRSNRLNRQSQRNSDRDYALQDELARSGIRLRVADAKAAGLHPLSALGVPLASGGGNQAMFTDPVSSDIAWNLGQDNSRATNATRTTLERSKARNDSLQTERMELENDLLRSQIRKINASPNPPFPSATDDSRRAIAGQAGSEVEIRPAQPTATHPGIPSQEAGAIADRGFTRTSPTTFAVIPSLDVKERIEDQWIPETAWAARNLVAPATKSIFNTKRQRRKAPPQEWLPKGYTHWKFNPFTMEWKAQKTRHSNPFPRG